MAPQSDSRSVPERHSRRYLAGAQRRGDGPFRFDARVTVLRRRHRAGAADRRVCCDLRHIRDPAGLGTASSTARRRLSRRDLLEHNLWLLFERQRWSFGSHLCINPEATSGGNAAEAAVFGLMGLLFAFTFYGAA